MRTNEAIHQLACDTADKLLPDLVRFIGDYANCPEIQASGIVRRQQAIKDVEDALNKAVRLVNAFPDTRQKQP